MRKNALIKPRKRNKFLPEVAKITRKSYSYVRQVACNRRSNTLVERAIIAYEENDFATLEQIKQQVSSNLQPAA